MFFWVIAKDGLLGSEVCRFFQNNQIPFVATSHQEADILDEKALENFYQSQPIKPTHIVNCSAYVLVDEAENSGRKLAFALNVTGPKNLTALAKKHDMRLIHIGTDYVFDGEKLEDYTESDPTSPINEYGKTKLLGEEEVVSYDKGLCIRTASLYGPTKPGIVSGIIDLLKTKESVGHIIDQVSSPTYTKDLAEAIFAIKDQKGVFHFTNSGYTSRYELVVYVIKLAKELGIEIKCKEVKPVLQKNSKRAAIRPKRSVLSCEKITPFLKQPIRTWESALTEYMSTYANT
jgi:dTDP-4-dehydrorhamnose reductase